MKEYKFTSTIHAGSNGGAYVIFPYDIREEFNKGRVKVQVSFEGVEYSGSIVNMGVLDDDGQICYIIGMLKSIRTQLNKDIGDTLVVIVKESEV